MLTNLRNWLQRQVSSRRVPTYDQMRETAHKSREDRATTITNLQKEVRDIQQQISDLSDAMDARPSGTSTDLQMTDLQRRLTEKQAELSRYQARI